MRAVQIINVICVPTKNRELGFFQIFRVPHWKYRNPKYQGGGEPLMHFFFLTSKRSAAAIIWSKIIHLHYYVLTLRNRKSAWPKPPDPCPKNVGQFSSFNCGKYDQSSALLRRRPPPSKLDFCVIYFRLVKMCLMKGNHFLWYSFL